MIGDIRQHRLEDEPDVFGDRELLHGAEVMQIQARPLQDVYAGIAKTSLGRNGERRGIK